MGAQATVNRSENEKGYKPHGGNSLVGLVESFAGRGRLQLATHVEKPARTVTFAGAAAKPDMSSLKIAAELRARIAL